MQSLKHRERILAHDTAGRNQFAGTNDAEADDEERNKYEQADRNRRRKASGVDHRDPQDFSRRVVRACGLKVRMVTAEFASRIAQVTTRTIYRWAETGRLHSKERKKIKNAHAPRS